MPKKDFSNANTARVYGAMKEATAEPMDDYDAQRMEEIEKSQQPDDYAQQRYQEQEKSHPELFTPAEPPKTPVKKKQPARREVRKPISFYIEPSLYEQMQTLARFRAATGEKNRQGQAVGAGSLINEAIAEYLERNRDELEQWEQLSAQMAQITKKTKKK